MERRSFQRFATDLQTVYSLVNDSDFFPARIRNVSKVGINILVNEPIESGEMLQIQLPTKQGDTLTTVLACVMHCGVEENGKYSLGCVFSEELHDREMSDLGEGISNTGSSPRAEPKSELRLGSITIQRIPTEHHPALQGEIISISPSGIHILVSTKISPGAVLSLEVASRHEVPFSILGCVVYLNERVDSQQFLIGCNFIRELDDHEIKEII